MFPIFHIFLPFLPLGNSNNGPDAGAGACRIINRLFVSTEELQFVLRHSGTPGCCGFVLRPPQSQSNPSM